MKLCNENAHGALDRTHPINIFFTINVHQVPVLGCAVLYIQFELLELSGDFPLNNILVLT